MHLLLYITKASIQCTCFVHHEGEYSMHLLCTSRRRIFNAPALYITKANIRFPFVDLNLKALVTTDNVSKQRRIWSDDLHGTILC